MTDQPPPLLSFAMPVRNGAKCIASALDSLLSQEFDDFEIVVSDNASDDGTGEILTSYAERDERVRYCPSEQNIGQNPNFNRVLELARGKYFRWIGMDDRLEPSYAAKCVATLEAHPEAIGVTTYQMHIDAAGNQHYAEYTGQRLESPVIHERFRRMIWFLSADYRYLDPIYTMYRREAILSTHRLRIVPTPDQVLAAELSLQGPIRHVAECLSTRHREPTYYHDRKRLAAQYQPGGATTVRPSPLRYARVMAATVHEFPMPRWSRVRCYGALVLHVLRHARRRFKKKSRRVLQSLIPASIYGRIKRLAGREHRSA